MLTREDFKKSFTSPEGKILEVLLDLRDLQVEQNKLLTKISKVRRKKDASEKS